MMETCPVVAVVVGCGMLVRHRHAIQYHDIAMNRQASKHPPHSGGSRCSPAPANTATSAATSPPRHSPLPPARPRRPRFGSGQVDAPTFPARAYCRVMCVCAFSWPLMVFRGSPPPPRTQRANTQTYSLPSSGSAHRAEAAQTPVLVQRAASYPLILGVWCSVCSPDRSACACMYICGPCQAHIRTGARPR